VSISHFSLFKKGRRYYIQFVDAEGKRKQKSTHCKRKPDAMKAFSDFRDLLRKKPQHKLLSDFITELLAFAQENFARRTVIIYRSTLQHFARIAGNVTLTAITPQQWDSYRTERLKTIQAVTVNIELRALRASFNVALRWKLLESNPFSGLKLVPVPEASPSFFTKEDFQKLLSLIKESWLRELILFAVLTGMRRSELVNLRWQDVDLQRRLVFIQSSATFKTKQGKHRTIPINDVAFHLLQTKCGKETSEYVFTLNGKKIFEEWVTHKFKYYVYEARLRNDRLHFHSLRHTFASWLVQDGVSLYAVQKLLGHSSSRVTEVYSHLQPESLHAEVNKISVSMN
jgi:site-specific recombinase XerD